MSDYPQPQSDHDAIVTLVSEVRQARTEIKDVKADIKELKDNVAQRVSDLESQKVNREEILRLKNEAEQVHDKFDRRLSRLERAYLIGTGVLLTLEFYFRYFDK